MKKFRHELKYPINGNDALLLMHQLPTVMEKDAHSEPNGYIIRSLYFDSFQDRLLQEKLDGDDNREKFRIRYYNNEFKDLRLEIKEKRGSMTHKVSTAISFDDVQSLLEGDVDVLLQDKDIVKVRFYAAIRKHHLRPVSIVSYRRIAYVLKYGNVRITLDTEIHVSKSVQEFLDPTCISYSIQDPKWLLEVKYDEFLPDMVKYRLQLKHRQASAMSKYSLSRGYI